MFYNLLSPSTFVTNGLHTCTQGYVQPPSTNFQVWKEKQKKNHTEKTPLDNVIYS